MQPIDRCSKQGTILILSPKLCNYFIKLDWSCHAMSQVKFTSLPCMSNKSCYSLLQFRQPLSGSHYISSPLLHCRPHPVPSGRRLPTTSPPFNTTISPLQSHSTSTLSVTGTHCSEREMVHLRTILKKNWQDTKNVSHFFVETKFWIEVNSFSHFHKTNDL
jgi:hypothetical protein